MMIIEWFKSHYHKIKYLKYKPLPYDPRQLPGKREEESTRREAVTERPERQLPGPTRRSTGKKKKDRTVPSAQTFLVLGYIL